MKKMIWIGLLMVLCQVAFANGQILPCNTKKWSYCIQAASFQQPANARHYEKLLRSKTSYRVQMVHHKNRYLVIVGPIRNVKAAQRLSIKLPPPKKLKTQSRHSSFFLQWPRTTQRQWFLTVGGGVAFPSFGRTNLFVPNNSGFPSPYNQDAYTVHQKPQPLFNLGLGRRWENANHWFPAYSLGLYYQHFFSTNMGNQITQYSAPGFTNYQFHWDLSSDVFLVGAKLNLLHWGRVLPYVTGGLGCAFNKSSGYGEFALPGLTDTRVSPSYQSQTKAQFAYNVGAGFDVQLTKAFLLSTEYQFLSLGNNSLGHGEGSWSSESLNLGKYRANAALLSLTYLFK